MVVLAETLQRTPQTVETLLKPHPSDVQDAHFQIENPKQFIGPEEQEFLSHTEVVHIVPPVLPLPPEERKYGGIEDVARNIILALDHFGVKKQHLYGHPKNKILADRIFGVEAYSPDFLDPNIDYIKMLREEPEKAKQVERNYLLWAFKNIRTNGGSIVHDHTKGGRFIDGDLNNYFMPTIRTEHGPLKPSSITDEEEAHALSHFDEQKEGVGFVAISEHQMRQRPSLNWLGVSHNGVNLGDFAFKASKPKDAPLLFLGRITPDKGTHNAIKLARRTKNQLLIVGEFDPEKDAEYWEREIEPNIDNDQIVHINGAGPDLRRDILSDALALVMLNEWDEPFGMVMPEALASGTPIIGSRKGSIPEIVKPGTGFIADSMDEAEYFVSRVKAGEYMPWEGRRLVEKEFSSLAMGARYARLLMAQHEQYNRTNSHTYTPSPYPTLTER